MLGKENYVKYVLRNKCHMSPWSLGCIQAKELLRTEDSKTERNKTKQKKWGLLSSDYQKINEYISNNTI